MTSKRWAAGPPEHGACRCCERSFTAEVTDPETQCRHDRDGYCGACYKRGERAGRHPTPNTVVPAGMYRCPFTTEENAAHLEAFLNTIAGASRRVRPWARVTTDRTVEVPA